MYCTDFVVYPSEVIQFCRISNFRERNGRVWVTVIVRTLVMSSTTLHQRRVDNIFLTKDIIHDKLQIRNNVVQHFDLVIIPSEVLQFCRMSNFGYVI